MPKLAKTLAEMLLVPAYALIATFFLVWPAIAETFCSYVAAGSDAYIRATEAVSRLPEFEAWSSAHSLPVAFNVQSDAEVVINGKSYRAVSVYAEHPERLELWHIFAVRVGGGVKYVQSPTSGAFVSLEAWRTQLQNGYHSVATASPAS